MALGCRELGKLGGLRVFRSAGMLGRALGCRGMGMLGWEYLWALGYGVLAWTMLRS